MATREEELERIPPMKVDKSEWPNELRTIGIDEADAFSVDKNHTLHWNGQPLEIKRPLVLTRTQAVGAAVAAISMAIFDFIRLLNGH